MTLSDLDPYHVLRESMPVDPAMEPGPIVRCMADIAPVPVRWLWTGRVPLGRLTLLVGRPGEGKSFFTMDAASRVSRGTAWPDGSPCPAGSALIVSGEDNPGDTIRPRLDAHQADVSKVHLLHTFRILTEVGESREVIFTLDQLHALRETLRKIGDCRLIVIDPVGSFLPSGLDAHRENDVRAILAPLAKIAEEFDVAVLLIAHRRKSMGQAADDLALGSRAFTGIARATWHLCRDKSDRQRRLLLPGKNNLAAQAMGLAFTIAGDPPTVQWEPEPIPLHADDALDGYEAENAPSASRPCEAREAAEHWLREWLSTGPALTAELISLAQAEGISRMTLHRASERLQVQRYRRPEDSQWTWRLPATYHLPASQNGEDQLPPRCPAPALRPPAP